MEIFAEIDYSNKKLVGLFWEEPSYLYTSNQCIQYDSGTVHFVSLDLILHGWGRILLNMNLALKKVSFSYIDSELNDEQLDFDIYGNYSIEKGRYRIKVSLNEKTNITSVSVIML